MEDVIRIKCPFCGSVLKVKRMPGMEGKKVNCPVCKNKTPFTDFQTVPQSKPAEPERYYEPATRKTAAVGWLRMPDGRAAVLHEGKNIVGRKTSKPSEADILVDTNGNKQMSRCHLCIDVTNDPVRGFMHSLSLFKEMVNDTFVDEIPVYFGDHIPLRSGNVIKVPGAELKFEIPEADDKAAARKK